VLNLLPRLRLAVAATLVVVAVSSGLVSAQVAETSPQPQSAALTSPVGTWDVVAYDPWNEGLVEPLDGSTLTLSLLDDDELTGETGCGRFNGGWTIDEGGLRAGIAQTGYFGCADAQTEEAIGFSAAVDAVVGWRQTADGIELVDRADSPRLVLAPAVLAEPTGYWTVVRYRRPNGRLTEPLPDQPMALELNEYDRVAGSTGCRLLEGIYARDGGSIIIGPVDTVGLPCEGADRRAERQLLRALGEVIYWERTGDTLSLNDGFDELLVELVLATEGEAYAVPPATTEPNATDE
jgi:heat shock protein HslJ